MGFPLRLRRSSFDEKTLSPTTGLAGAASLACAAIALLLCLVTTAAADQSSEDGLYIYVRWPYLAYWKDKYEAALDADYVDGASISLEWNRIEPNPGVYDWSSLDPWLKKTVGLNKKLALGVIAGDFAPQWLYGPGFGAARVQFQFNKYTLGAVCATLNQPVFWSPVYLKTYARLLDALANHLRQVAVPGRKADAVYDALRVIKVSGINVTTEELRVPANKPDNGPCKQSDAAALWAAAGYTPAKALAAWATIAKATDRAFPDKILAVDIIHRRAFPPIDDEGRPFELAEKAPDALTAKIIDLGISLFHRRFMVKWDALSQARILPAEVIDAGRSGAKIGWQMNDFLGVRGGSGCIYAPFAIRACDNLDDFRAIIDNGVAKGGKFIEIQPPNANASFAPAFRRAHSAIQAADP